VTRYAPWADPPTRTETRTRKQAIRNALAEARAHGLAARHRAKAARPQTSPPRGAGATGAGSQP